MTKIVLFCLLSFSISISDLYSASLTISGGSIVSLGQPVKGAGFYTDWTVLVRKCKKSQ